MSRLLRFAGFFLFLLCACHQKTDIPLSKGMRITQSVTVEKGDYLLPGADSLNAPLIVISGHNLTVDFNGATLIGSDQSGRPDQFKGLGILIDGGRNITIKNLNLKGYKIGLMAVGVDSLVLEDSDLSYNYRKRLGSHWDREDFEDWMSYHQNDNNEWHRYGAAIYLERCREATVRNVRVNQGQNALLMTGCTGGLFYNNNFSYNSGLGIGMYRSSHNRIMHNKLDWNIRGFVFGRYNRGQDSSGILAYEQSSNNVFAYNSATHSGDGFFLWAGQETMDSGQGGCNDNLVFGNNFSYASNNGVEITFSSNQIVNNKLTDCDYGVWGGYSYQTLIRDNYFANNNYGVAFEHGQNNRITNNTFVNDQVGIRLWERASQPAGWGFAERRNVDSKNYHISNNIFAGTPVALRISSSDSLSVESNIFANAENKLVVDGPPNRELIMDSNAETSVKQRTPHYSVNLRHEMAPAPMPDAREVDLPENQLKGRQYILVNEWGPYNFQYPTIWLRSIIGDQYTFALFGPQGNWKITGGEGFRSISRNTGSMPATLVAERDSSEADLLHIALQYIGEEVVTQFGDTLHRGQTIPFSFKRFEKAIPWEVRWYEYGKEQDPLLHYAAFRQMRNQEPLARESSPQLAYVWWEKPAKNIRADRFASFCSSEFNIAPGNYEIALTSDDGAKLWLDGELIIDHWDIHEPLTDRVEVELGGTHQMEIEHFDEAGLANLVFRIFPKGEPQ